MYLNISNYDYRFFIIDSNRLEVSMKKNSSLRTKNILSFWEKKIEHYVALCKEGSLFPIQDINSGEFSFYINEENIYFNTGYNPKILNRKNYQRKYPLESLKFVYPWIFLEPHYITSKTEHRNYSSRVHFEFDGEKKYDSWGACISIEEAGKIVERIISFLEKQKK